MQLISAFHPKRTEKLENRLSMNSWGPSCWVIGQQKELEAVNEKANKLENENKELKRRLEEFENSAINNTITYQNTVSSILDDSNVEMN